jgi:Homeodomain-like domain
MHIRYRVDLEESERGHLEAIVAGGTRAVRRVKRAQILLAAAAGVSDAAIAASLQVGTSTVYRTKQHFVERGLDRALAEGPRRGGQRKLVALFDRDGVRAAPRRAGALDAGAAGLGSCAAHPAGCTRAIICVLAWATRVLLLFGGRSVGLSYRLLLGFGSSRFVLRSGLVGFIGSTIQVSPQYSHS